MRSELSTAAALVAAPKRRVILNYPPVSSVWHYPSGIAILTAILREQGHEVIQRYGHIIGLEYLLKQYGGSEAEWALKAIRDSRSDVHALYCARQTLERISRMVPGDDGFAVERNNIKSIAHDTVEKALQAVTKRQQNRWYPYFTQVEVPFALEFQPEVYGISIADERQFIQGLILASLIKDRLPQCLVVLGGNFWARVTDSFWHPHFSWLFDHCDAIVPREGFRRIEELVAVGRPDKVAGVAWRKKPFWYTRVNKPKAETPASFEDLPTPLYDGGATTWTAEPVYSLYTMSNCPMQCLFCAISAGSDTFLGKPRSMTPRRIAEHMKAIGGSRFDIFDETFPIPRQLALGAELKKIGQRATWQCYLTVTDQLTKPKVCYSLYQAGCRAVQLGLETLSVTTLGDQAKSWNHPENYGRILQNLRDAMIQTHVFLLIGLPGEPIHWGLKWLAFLEKYGDAILTIKSGRYQLTRQSPEARYAKHSELIMREPDRKPFRLNLDFHYAETYLKKDVEAMRDVLEEACRRHWAYALTSTVPWWANRGRFSWEELRAMAIVLPPEPETPHLKRAIARMEKVVLRELGQQVTFSSFEDLLAFSRTL